MKVKELIEHLQKMPQDLEVYSYCDHGQIPEKTSVPQVGYAEALHYMLDDYNWSMLSEEAEENNFKNEFVLL